MVENTQNQPSDDLAKLQSSPQLITSWQKAQQHPTNGHHAPALASYRNLVQQFPGVSQLWAELGIAAAGDLDFALANQASQRAAELASTDASMLISIGAQYYQ